MTDQQGAAVEDGRRPLLANAPLQMEDPRGAWRVGSGRAQVFAVLGEGGRRIPVCSVEEGDWALPAPVGAGVQLLLVSVVADTTVSPVALPAEADGPVPPSLAGPEVRQAIESWVERLAQAVGDTSPPDGVGLVAGEHVELSEAQAAWPEHRSVWIDAGADLESLQLFGDAVFTQGAGQHDGTVVPLPATAWIRAEHASSIVVLSGAQALARPGGWRGVQLFCGAALSRLRVHLGRSQTGGGQALAEREREELRLDTRVYTRLSRVLDAAGGQRPEPATDDPTARALSMVADATGVELRLPERLE
ncbi:MAG TPA: hypothetical protein VF005_03110, partial [Acidimicrobiales bacterium]